MLRQILVAVGIVGSLIVAIGYTKYLKVSAAIAQAASFAMPPEAITSITVKLEQWPQTFSAVGSIAPVQGVTLSAEEPGKVTKIAFESGETVQAGQLLAVLDASVEEAQLKGAYARKDRAMRSLTRSEKLRATNAVSQDDLDAAKSVFQQAVAEVESLQATIERKKIVAPFAGRTGIRMINLGQYVAAGTPVVPLHSLDPMFANFSLTEKAIGKLSVGQKLTATVDAFPGRAFEGKVTAINPQVDEATRNVQVQGTLPNAESALRPGMFASIQVELAEVQSFITVPATSISFAPYGDSVYVVEKTKSPEGKETLTVRQQVVKLGKRRGDQIAIVSGLSDGQEIATSGLFRLRPGAAVIIDNKFAPSNSAAPTPADT